MFKCVSLSMMQNQSHSFARGYHSISTPSLSNYNEIRTTNPSTLQANCPHDILTKIHKAFAWSVISPVDTIVTPLASDKNINVDQYNHAQSITTTVVTTRKISIPVIPFSLTDLAKNKKEKNRLTRIGTIGRLSSKTM